MPRVTKSVTAKAKHKKTLKSAKGFYGAKVDYIKRQTIKHKITAIFF